MSRTTGDSCFGLSVFIILVTIVASIPIVELWYTTSEGEIEYIADWESSHLKMDGSILSGATRGVRVVRTVISFKYKGRYYDCAVSGVMGSEIARRQGKVKVIAHNYLNRTKLYLLSNGQYIGEIRE